MERVIEMLEVKAARLEVVKFRRDQQFKMGNDIAVYEVAFYDEDLHQQIVKAISMLKSKSGLVEDALQINWDLILSNIPS